MAPAGFVVVAYPLAAIDDSGGGKIRPRERFDQLVELDVRIFQNKQKGVTELPEIVRRYVRRHADGDSRRAVEEEIGNARGKNGGLSPGVVVVVDEIDSFLFDVGEYVLGDFGHARFGVAHCGGRIAVNGTEVALAVHQDTPHRKILGHPGEGGIDDRFAVGVVVSAHVAGDFGALAVGLGMIQAEVI